MNLHGLSVPLFSLRSKNSSGIGEILDLIPMIDFVSECGMDILQLLPINDTGGDNSPYNLLSSTKINPIYLSYSPPLSQDLNKTDLVEWEKVRALKQNTPENVQELLTDQMRQVKAYADKKGIQLMGDIPIFVSRQSEDVYNNPHYFDLTKTAGCPPDLYNSEGQNWNFPLYNWDALEKDHFSYWKNRLQTAEQFYHLYRIDHIVGFFRTYAFPEMRYIPSQKTQWMKQGTKILKQLLSFTNMQPIGEDLGVVPPEVRTIMKSLEIPGTKVMRWERQWDTDKSYIPLDQYDPLSLTTVSTHDSESLTTWWENGSEEIHTFCDQMNLTYTPKITPQTLHDLLKLSHHTTSRYHINLLNEYLPLFYPEQSTRINTPGTTLHSNWRYRLPPVEELLNNQELIKTLKELVAT